MAANIRIIELNMLYYSLLQCTYIIIKNKTFKIICVILFDNVNNSIFEEI